MRYEPEDILVQKMQSGEYCWKEYISHHSRELKDEYEHYCKFNGLDPEEEESAEAFVEMREQLLDEAINNGNV